MAFIPRHNITVDGSGHVSLAKNLVMSDGNVSFANGHGIDFSANTDDGGTSSGNGVFEDYEEGTWTPHIIGSTSSSSTHATLAQDKASYTKVGNVVTLTFYISISALNGITGSMRLANIPYQASAQGSANQHICTGSMMVNSFDLTTNKNWVVPYISDSATDIKFYQSGDQTGWVETTSTNLAGAAMIGEVMYRTV